MQTYKYSNLETEKKFFIVLILLTDCFLYIGFLKHLKNLGIFPFYKSEKTT